MIIANIVSTTPGVEETVEEFETDPQTVKKNIDDVLKKAPRTKTSRKKDPLVEEKVEDPQVTGKDIGDYEKPRKTSETITKIRDPTGKTVTRIVKRKPDGTETVEEYIEEQIVEELIGSSELPLEPTCGDKPSELNESFVSSSNDFKTSKFIMDPSADSSQNADSGDEMKEQLPRMRRSILSPTESFENTFDLHPMNENEKRVSDSSIDTKNARKTNDFERKLVEESTEKIDRKRAIEQNQMHEENDLNADDDWLKELKDTIMPLEFDDGEKKEMSKTRKKEQEKVITKESVEVTFVEPNGDEVSEEKTIEEDREKDTYLKILEKMIREKKRENEELDQKIKMKHSKYFSDDEYCIEKFETDMETIKNSENFENLIQELPNEIITQMKDPRGKIINRIIKRNSRGELHFEESINDPNSTDGIIDPVQEDMIKPENYLSKKIPDSTISLNDESEDHDGGDNNKMLVQKRDLTKIEEKDELNEDDGRELNKDELTKPDDKKESDREEPIKPDDKKEPGKEAPTKPKDKIEPSKDAPTKERDQKEPGKEAPTKPDDKKEPGKDTSTKSEDKKEPG
ncbi:hypothetical protein QR98_0058570, partial [Sarcoptes scabiei]